MAFSKTEKGPHDSTDQELMDDLCKCLICNEYAHHAVESDCCGQIYCETCLTPEKIYMYEQGGQQAAHDQLVKKIPLERIASGINCPKCTTPFLSFKPSGPARRYVAQIPTNCRCGTETTRGELESHEVHCAKSGRKYECPLCHSHTQGRHRIVRKVFQGKDEFFDHLKADHSYAVMASLGLDESFCNEMEHPCLDGWTVKHCSQCHSQQRKLQKKNEPSS